MLGVLNDSILALMNAIAATIPDSLEINKSYAVSPLSAEARSLILREDNHDARVVHVFDETGEKLLTFEQPRKHSKYWYAYSQPERKQVASLKIGVLNREIHQAGNKITVLRAAASGLRRSFYDSDGHMYSWNRQSHFLERIVNPAGGHEEHRKQVAFLHQLRSNRLDWELLVDTKEIDLVDAISTAFVTLKTQYPARRVGVPGVRCKPSYVQQTPVQAQNYRLTEQEIEQLPVAEFVNNDVNELRVFEPKQKSPMAREFFNPPDFLSRI